jgi:hypothetical protein
MSDIFRIGAIGAGDIVFVYDRSQRVRDKIMQFVIVNGPRILAWFRKTEQVMPFSALHKYSHVMLGVGSGLIIHADGETVAVEIISDALVYETKVASTFQIYRRKDISSEIASKIVKSAMRYYNRKYRFSSFFSESRDSDTTQFCSRLVAHAYRAAGIPLTLRTDHKVLPVDLYKICQSDAWEDISSMFVRETNSPMAEEVLPPIEIPGHEKMSIAELNDYVEDLILKQAKDLKELQKLSYLRTQGLLTIEGLEAQSLVAQFDLSKNFYAMPSALDDRAAASIALVLRLLLKPLLELSRLPSIELLVTETFLNTSNEGTIPSQYAGMPTPQVIREMQLLRAEITIYDKLFLAEIGLSTILAHCTQFDQFARFRSVKKEFADLFLAALPPVEDLSSYEGNEDNFMWVEQESNRARCRTIFRHIR